VLSAAPSGGCPACIMTCDAQTVMTNPARRCCPTCLPTTFLSQGRGVCISAAYLTEARASSSLAAGRMSAASTLSADSASPAGVGVEGLALSGTPVCVAVSDAAPAASRCQTSGCGSGDVLGELALELAACASVLTRTVCSSVPIEAAVVQAISDLWVSTLRSAGECSCAAGSVNARSGSAVAAAASSGGRGPPLCDGVFTSRSGMQCAASDTVPLWRLVATPAAASDLLAALVVTPCAALGDGVRAVMASCSASGIDLLQIAGELHAASMAAAKSPGPAMQTHRRERRAQLQARLCSCLQAISQRHINTAQVVCR